MDVCADTDERKKMLFFKDIVQPPTHAQYRDSEKMHSIIY